jgi:hypothetical protein
MRAAVMMTMIIVGGALVAAPLVADYALKTTHEANVVRLMEKPGASSVNLYRDELSNGLCFGCWFTGTALAATGIYLAVREARGLPTPAPQPG